MQIGRCCIYEHISIHALLAESDPLRVPAEKASSEFLSTLSLRRATSRGSVSMSRYRNFYPRSPCGERHLSTTLQKQPSYFYPRSPCGERPRCNGILRGSTLFLSTLSLRRATRSQLYQTVINAISIHALLAESDGIPSGGSGGADAFLSTLSLRRATPRQRPARGSVQHFYPRSPCGERLDAGTGFFVLDEISIHALLAESDGTVCFGRPDRSYFYPRSPCGERPLSIVVYPMCFLVFLSTLSLRRATGGPLPTITARFTFLSTLSLRRATRVVCNQCS